MNDRVARALIGEPEYKDQLEYLRPETMGAFTTPAPMALMQMFDPMGLTPAQLDQNAAMRGPLMQSAYRQNPELLTGEPPLPRREGFWSRPEDLNSVMLKYGNWRKQATGQELTPQERVTQGFLDVRNPNSWW